MTTSETNDQAALKLHYANKHPESSKTFEETYLITFTDSTSNHSNLNYLESKWVNLLKANINLKKNKYTFLYVMQTYKTNNFRATSILLN